MQSEREREREKKRERKKEKKEKNKKGISYLAAAPDDVRIRLELVGTFFPISLFVVLSEDCFFLEREKNFDTNKF